jgi:hypothetical protein
MRFLAVFTLATALVFAPIALAYLVVKFSAVLIAFGLLFVETMAKAQITALLVLAPLILADRLFIWARRKGWI